jgi:hypothetical protein
MQQFPKVFAIIFIFCLSLSNALLPATAAQADDTQAALARIEANLHALPEVAWLPAPFNNDEALAWVDLAATTKIAAEEAIAELQQIAATAELPLTRGTVQQGAAYDRQDLGRLQRLAETRVQRIDETVAETLGNLRGQFEIQNRELEYFRELDPDNPNHRSNAFLADGAQERVYGQLQAHLGRAESVVAWQWAFGLDAPQSAVDRINEINMLRERYALQRTQLIASSRLPEPASEDPQLLAIAQQILANPAYEFGTHGPIVLTTSAVTEHEREVSRAEIREMDVSLSGTVTLSGTQTTWQYRWQEFRFATPIQDNSSGNWHVWWITARNYSSGWERTPLGRWVSAVTVQGDLIPAGNF